MGFKAPGLTDIVLEFDEHSELQGAEIRCRAIPIKRIGEFDSLDFDEFTRRLVDDVLISWNFEDERGDPLPLTVESFQDLPAWLPMEIRQAWNRGLLTPPKR